MIIETVLAACLCGSVSAAGTDIAGDSVMRKEADRFVTNMSPALQPGQRDAIWKAIRGDNTDLAKVRNARNGKPQYPANVAVSEPAPRLRLYTNTGGTEKDRPLLVYFHGGGWTIGSLNSCARFCSEVCSRGNINVLAVDYRLAPEYPYPVPLDDCEQALRYAIANAGSWGCSKNRIVVGGDSSGGNLAIASAMRMDKGEVSQLLLFYPVVKAWNDGSASWRNWGKGYGLDGDLMEAFNRSYATAETALKPEVSPMQAADKELARLPQTLLIAAERDILADQGREFVERINRLGVDAARIEFPGSVHLFITVPGQNAAFGKAVSLSIEFINGKKQSF